MIQTLTVVGSWAQTWPLAAVWAQAIPRPQVAAQASKVDMTLTATCPLDSSMATGSKPEARSSYGL